MRDKIVTVTLGEDLYVKGPHVFQYDYGLVLVLDGIQLPAEYEVHFSNKKHGVAKKGEAAENGVKIPDEYLRSGEDVFAWVYLRNGDEDGYTVYSIQLPVIARSVEQGDNVSPVEHNIIDKALEALAEAVEECEENVRHYPIINDNGNWMLYDAVAGEYVDTGLSAVGEDGFSPTVQITEIEDGNRVTITDAYGDHTFDVLNGGSFIDDTAGAGDTDKVWSADKTAAEISSLNDEVSEKADASDLPVVPVFSKNGEDVYTCNMPFAEVYAAVNEGKCTACLVLSTLTGKVDTCASLVASSSYAIKFSWSEPRPQQEHVYGIVVQFTNDEAVEITSQILSLGDYIAPTYSRTMFPITAGTYCLKNGGMYKAKEDISRYETFNPEKWDLVDVSTEISAISEELSDIDSAVSEKADKTDTVLNTTLSRGRTDGSSVGEGSFAFGSDVEASGELFFAEGNSTKANGAYSHVGGMYNIPDSYDGFDEWTAGTQYNVGDKVKVTNETTVNGYICKTANSDSSFMPFKWIDMQGRMNYAEIIGNGADENNRSNARALDWEGNEYLAGDLYVRSNIGSAAGSKVATLDAAGKVPTSQLPSYVDDVVEYPSLNDFPNVGEPGKIYVAIDTNMTYRWSGSTYIMIGGGDLSTKADKADTVLDTTLSRGRRSDSTVGTGSFAFGEAVTASGAYSHAEGSSTVASGDYSHAEGFSTKATNHYSHAEGKETTANGYAAHAEGYKALASNSQAHAEGEETVASGSNSHAEGYKTGADGYASHAEGLQAVATQTGAHAEGSGTTASGQSSHAEGSATVANSHAAHAEGISTTASHPGAHAEGYVTKALDDHCHAEGENTTADNNAAHAEGSGTYAGGYAAHAEGGRYASGDTKTIDSQSYHYGATGGYSHSEGIDTISYGPRSHAEGSGTSAIGESSHTEGSATIAKAVNSHAEGASTYASGAQAHAEGAGTTASGSNSHAEGASATASGAQSHAEGAGTIASGVQAHAEGSGAEASGPNAHAEGGGTHAIGYAAHAEGVSTYANGDLSHAEGNSTHANGVASHAEGEYTVANGRYSHVSGRYNVEDNYINWPEWAANTDYAVGDKVKRTTTQNNETVVKGYICRTANSDPSFDSSKWVEDSSINYAVIVGNGAYNNPSNAYSLDWDGNGHFKGDVYIGCNADGTGGTKLGSVVFATDAEIQDIIDDWSVGA